MSISGRSRIDELDPITTPDDTAEAWVRDPTEALGSRNRRWSLTNIIAWIKGELGTAATEDVTTSATDTTAGRVLKVGAGGLLGQIIEDGLDDLDDETNPSGLWHTATANMIGTFPVSNGHTLIMRRLGGARVTQLFFAQGLDTIYRRNYNGTIWSAWQELYHTGNYPSDTAWTETTSLDNGWTGTVRYIKRAGMVTVVGDALDGRSAAFSTCLTLLSAYQPDVLIRGTAKDQTKNVSYLLGVSTVGNVQILAAKGDADADYLGFSITYPVL